MSLNSVIDANHKTLSILVEQVSLLSSRVYTQTTILTDSGIGGHVRHILEHYQELSSGLEGRHICYDNRIRDQRLEESPEAAVAALNSILLWLQSVKKGGDLQLKLTAATSGSKQDNSTTTETSLVRELLFLQSHTVHHEAIIAMLMKAQSIEVPTEFGVAPATLQYREDIMVTS